MTRDEFDAVLRVFYRQKPFRPFTLELSNGSRVEVNHPEALTIKGNLLVVTTTTHIRSVFHYENVVRFISATGVG